MTRKKAALITGIICSIVMLGSMALYLHGYVRRSNLTEHVESMTGLSLKNLTMEEDGDIETAGGEDYGHIRLKLKKGGIEDVKVQLSAMGKTPLAEMKDNMPSYEEHRLAQDLKKDRLGLLSVLSDQICVFRPRREAFIFNGGLPFH